MPRGVIFDLDGVIVDAVEWHFLAFQEALSLFGYEMNPEEHHEIYNGLPTSAKLKILSMRRGLPGDLHGLINEMKQKYTRRIIEEACGPKENISKTLQYLKENGFRLALASNSVRSTVQLVLDKMEIRDYFDYALSNEDVKQPKPAPEIFNKCLELMGLSPEECFIIEDSVPGLEAARKASPNVIAVAGPHEVNLELIKSRVIGGNPQQVRLLFSGSRRAENGINIVIPLESELSGFPRYLKEINGKPMIQWVIDGLTPKRIPYRFTFLCRKEHLTRFGVDKVLNQIEPSCNIVTVSGVTRGPACMVLLAKRFINNSDPLLLASPDQVVNLNIDELLAKEAADGDGWIATFPSNDARGSYAAVDSANRVTEVSEKRLFNRNATAGIYYLKQGRDFVTNAEEMIRQDLRVNNRFPIYQVYNQLITKNKNIRIQSLGPNCLRDLEAANEAEKVPNWKEAA